jgi:hypothetical protein
MEVSVSDGFGEAQTARVTQDNKTANLRFYADAQGHDYVRHYYYTMNCFVDGIYDDAEGTISTDISDYPLYPGQETTKYEDIVRGDLVITIEIVLSDSGAQ